MFRAVTVWAAALLAAMLAPAAGQGSGPIEGRDFFVHPPAETWAAERWPLVVVLAGPEHDLKAVLEQFGDLTSDRGALLLAMFGGDTSRLPQLIKYTFEHYPALAGATVLVGEGRMGLVCREQTLQRKADIAGFIGIDLPMGLPVVAAPGPRQRAALLYTRTAFRDTAIRLRDELQRQGLECAAVEAPAPELMFHVGRAMTALLPASPARQALHDPVTNTYFGALPGYQFVRADGLFAVAQPLPGQAGPDVQIFTGLLGERTFEEYVRETQQALNQDGIELLGQEDLSGEEAAVKLHSFHFIDRRGKTELAKYWVQLAHGKQWVSLLSVAPRGQLEASLPLVRSMALAVSFGAPGEQGARAGSADEPPAGPVEPAGPTSQTGDTAR